VIPVQKQRPLPSRDYLRGSFTQGYIGFGCLVVGIIGNILERAVGFTLGLEATSWYLIAIAFLLLYVGHFVSYMQAKKEE